jgi:hypothetical protein
MMAVVANERRPHTAQSHQSRSEVRPAPSTRRVVKSDKAIEHVSEVTSNANVQAPILASLAPDLRASFTGHMPKPPTAARSDHSSMNRGNRVLSAGTVSSAKPVVPPLSFGALPTNNRTSSNVLSTLIDCGLTWLSVCLTRF